MRTEGLRPGRVWALWQVVEGAGLLQPDQLLGSGLLGTGPKGFAGQTSDTLGHSPCTSGDLFRTVLEL